MKLTHRTITAQDIIDLEPCYEDEQVHALVPEPTDLASLLDLDIPNEDIVWAVTRLIESKRERVWLGAQFVRKTPLHDGRTVYDLLTDERSIAAIEVCEAYALGHASDEELEDAWDAAWAIADAARAAAGAAAWAAAHAAAGYIAQADQGARDAARAAAWAAAGDTEAAKDAARDAQVTILRNSFK